LVFRRCFLGSLPKSSRLGKYFFEVPMSAVMPQSELLRRAFAWINDTLADDPRRDTHSLLDEAGMRFNLAPAETEQLLRLLRRSDPPK
jgi:hypothetical protein